MYATQELRDEHQGIKTAIAVLDRLASDVEDGCAVDVNDIEALLDFLKVFADKCHHAKEESLLFPAMEQEGAGRPTGAMIIDHSRGRKYLRTMNDALPGVRENDPAARVEFAGAAHLYATLLAQHIDKEERVVFSTAERQLTSDEHARLLGGFERIERESIGAGVHERYHALLDRLREKYLLSQAA